LFRAEKSFWALLDNIESVLFTFEEVEESTRLLKNSIKENKLGIIKIVEKF
jgi:hypothetical protein